VMASIRANELKTHGVKAIEQVLADNTEAIVSVRGKNKYVIMSPERYSYLSTCELEAAIHEARNDLAEGRFVTESPADHLRRVEAMD
jgi:PHD/YefM family antitoxin component YafN of YafNO toxin-antitoxin module